MLSLNRLGAGESLVKKVWEQTNSKNLPNQSGIRSSQPLQKNLLPTNNKPKNR